MVDFAEKIEDYRRLVLEATPQRAEFAPLGPPATLADIEECERITGKAFNGQLRDLYLVANGGSYLADGSWTTIQEIPLSTVYIADNEEPTEPGTEIPPHLHHSSKVHVVCWNPRYNYTYLINGPFAGQLQYYLPDAPSTVIPPSYESLEHYFNVHIEAAREGHLICAYGRANWSYGFDAEGNALPRKDDQWLDRTRMRALADFFERQEIAFWPSYYRSEAER